MHTVPNTLTHERVVVFVDYHNTLNALRREGQQIDLGALWSYLAEGRHVLEAFLYIATHPLPERHQADQATLHRLRQHGFLVCSRMGQLLPDGRLKCDFDLEMALDVQEFVARTRPDIVVLATGDGDFVPLAQRLRLRGVRVEVASTPGSVSAALRAMANGFVDLTRISQDVDNLPLDGDRLPAEAPGQLQPADAAGQPAPAPRQEAEMPIPMP